MEADESLPERDLFEFLHLARRCAKPGCVVSYSHLGLFQHYFDTQQGGNEGAGWGSVFSERLLPGLKRGGWREDEIHEPRLCLVEPAPEGVSTYRMPTALAPVLVVKKLRLVSRLNTCGGGGGAHKGIVYHRRQDLSRLVTGKGHAMRYTDEHSLTLLPNGRFVLKFQRFLGGGGGGDAQRDPGGPGGGGGGGELSRSLRVRATWVRGGLQ